MNQKPYVLLIAPHAPPRNGAEAIQVRRILKELDIQATGRLITVAPEAASWVHHDASLELKLNHFDTQSLRLPFHRLTSRVFMSQRFRLFHMPDSLCWIQLQAGTVIKQLTKKPDILYSRSFPLSAALLARGLKKQLSIPWIMHLSDPWADSPFTLPDRRHAKLEAACFEQANLITLTAQGQADFYKNKYPQFANKIIVLPNVMPDVEESGKWVQHLLAADDRLHIVFAGSLYGSRSPKPLLDALDIIRQSQPELLKKLRIDFYGKTQDHILKLLQSSPDIRYRGAVSYAEACAVQYASDIALTIEADSEHPLIKATLLSKVTDCFALGKPMLSITPEGSETERICKSGYGWSAAPSNPQEIAKLLCGLVEKLPELRAAKPKPAPEYYQAERVVSGLLTQMQKLIEESNR